MINFEKLGASIKTTDASFIWSEFDTQLQYDMNQQRTHEKHFAQILWNKVLEFVKYTIYQMK